MPRGNTYGGLTNPGSFRHMDRFGPSESALAQFLYSLARQDVVFLHEDFLLEEGTAITGSGIWVAAGLNGTDFAAPATQLASGVAQAAVNNVAADNNTLRTGAMWLGDNNCGMEIRLHTSNNATNLWETGFVDPLTSFDDLAMGDIDTPAITNGAVDVALVAQDTGQTLTTAAFITDGSTTNMNTTKTDLGTRTPTNSTFFTVRVQLAGDAARCFWLDANGSLQESASHGSTTASSTEGGTLRHAWLGWETLATTAKTITIDYITLWQDRYVRV